MVALPRQDALVSIDKSTSYDRRTADLGDGYRRIKRSGLNSRRDRYELGYVVMPVTEAQTLENDLAATEGVDTIEWTPPGETVQRRFFLDSMEITYVGQAARRVNITLLEKFL